MKCCWWVNKSQKSGKAAKFREAKSLSAPLVSHFLSSFYYTEDNIDLRSEKKYLKIIKGKIIEQFFKVKFLEISNWNVLLYLI